MPTIGGLLAPGTIVTGCVLIAPLRRMVHEGEPVAVEPAVDPAIRADLAAEPHIGRPDLGRDYDDGGLVDLNSAPAA